MMNRKDGLHLTGCFISAIFTCALNVAFATDISVNLSLASGDPRVPLAGFYGYRNSQTGPGDAAFDKCLECTKVPNEYIGKVRKLPEAPLPPMILIWGKDNCAQCSAFATSVNSDTRGFPGALSGQHCVNAYFRGTGSESPEKACAKARKFFDEELGGAADSCHLLGFYGVYPNGRKVTHSAKLGTNREQFLATIKGWADDYYKNYKNHLWTPPKGSSGFACGLGSSKSVEECCGLGEADYTRLEMTNGAETVYVPMVRTNNLTNVEKNWLRVTYPDSVTTNIAFNWAAKGPTATNLEIAVDVTGQWAEGGKVRLEYLNTNQVSLATNWITCVTAKNGTFESPWVPGAKAPEDLAWGEWTLDFAAATNKAAQTAEGAYLLVALCGTTWDADALRIWEGITGGDNFNDRFANFCRTNRIVTVLVDREDPKTGASLLTHNVSALRRSGTPFLSRNELCSTNETVRQWRADLKAIDAAYRRTPAASGGLQSELLLLRADGSVVGRLNPYFKNGDYSGQAAAQENRDRIFELFDLREDDNEELNNDPATTAMTLAYGGGQVTGNTLHISDTRDAFLLTNVPVDKPVKLTVSKPAFTRTMVRFTDKTHRAWTTVAPTTTDATGGDVWIFRSKEDTNDLAVIVSGFAGEEAAGTMWSQESMTAYGIEFADANTYEGNVDFCDSTKNPIGVVVETDWTNVTLYVERTGYTGAKDVLIDIDKNPLETTATNSCYIWKGPVALHWDELEAGVKSFTLTLTNDHNWVAGGHIHFIFSNDSSKDYYLYVEPKEDPTADVGKLAISSPSIPSEFLYLEEGTNLDVILSRKEGRRGELVGRLSVTRGGGELSPTNEFVWPRYDQGDKLATWKLPKLNGAPKLEATLTLSGSSNEVPIAEGADKLKVCLLPANAPKFVHPAADGVSVLQLNAVQYVNASGQIALDGGIPSGWKVTGVRNISGSLPDGLSVSVNALGEFKVSGQTAMQSGLSSSTWWLTFSDQDGKTSYSYPVRVSCNVQSLASLNPGFAETRIWTGFPLYIYRIDERDGPDHMRLVGAMDLTVRKDGTMSAKIRELGNKVKSFAADGLTTINLSDAGGGGMGDPGWETSVKGLAYITAEESFGGRKNKLHLYLYADGAMGVRLDDPDYAGEVYILQSSCNAGTVNWGGKLEDGSVYTAESWKGVYSMAFPAHAVFGMDKRTLCCGAPSVQARFLSASQWKTGRATYAGVLPNGRTFSGSATFVPRQPGVGLLCLPMLTISAADEFAALVAVSNGTEAACVVAAVPSETADTDAGRVFDLVTRWNHAERGFPQLSYSNDYTVVGSRFTATNDWPAVWGAERLAFGIDGELTDAGLVPDGWRIKSDHDALSAALNRSSGAMMGVFRESEDQGRIWHPYQWKGSALPGCEDFLLGAYWYNLQTNVWANGREMRKTVRAGGSVAVVEKK